MPIDNVNKAVFVHIPKTGGQSVSKLLGLKRGSSKQWYSNRHNYTHSTISQIKKAADVDDYYIFTFIRDPEERILSEYNHRMRNISARHLPVKHKCSFTDYMEQLYQIWKVGWEEIDQHYKAHVIPQTDYIDESVEIYKFEDFEDEANRLKQRLGINRPIPKVNESNDDKPAHTIKTLDIVNEIYETDFKLIQTL